MYQFSIRNMLLAVACAAVLFRLFSVVDDRHGERTDLIGFLVASAAFGALGGAFAGRPIKWAAITFAVIVYLLGLIITIESLTNHR